MAEEGTPKDLATTGNLPEGPTMPQEPGAATAEAMKRAPQAVRRSMPMALSITIGILLDTSGRSKVALSPRMSGGNGA